MITPGKHHVLQILRETENGFYLVNQDDDEVLLPNKYCSKEFEMGDKIEVFVYLDHEERPVAVTDEPKITLDHFAFLKVSATNQFGAFMDWGMSKELLVPFREQRLKMEKDRWYLIYLDLDEKTDRLFGSNRLDNYLSNDELSVKLYEEVQLLVMRKTELGYAVIVNELHKGLVFDNEIHRELNIGDGLKGYVKKIRDDNKLDISLQPIGFSWARDKNVQIILDALQKGEGFIPLTDKSPPEEINAKLGLSKKAFKKAVGGLYRRKAISLEKDGIRLTATSAEDS